MMQNENKTSTLSVHCEMYKIIFGVCYGLLFERIKDIKSVIGRVCAIDEKPFVKALFLFSHCQNIGLNCISIFASLAF